MKHLRSVSNKFLFSYSNLFFYFFFFYSSQNIDRVEDRFRENVKCRKQLLFTVQQSELNQPV